MRRQLFGFCHRLFDVMTFNAVDRTSPLDIVILARMIQVSESNFAERRLFSKDDRLRLHCRLLLAGNVAKAETWLSGDALRNNIKIRDEYRCKYRGN